MNETPDNLLKQLPAVYAMLGVVIVLGLLGNIIVIVVYLSRPHQQSATFFIIVLACVDIFACVVSIPFTIAIEAIKFRMHSLALCQAYYFLYISSIPFSSLLISAIAVDRYLYICYPMKRLMTTRRAKTVTLVLFVLATCVGVGAIFTVRLRLPERNATVEANASVPLDLVEEEEMVPMCEETGFLENATVVEKTLHLVVQQLNHGCYWLSIACVTLLYGMIFVTVIRLRRKRVIRLTLAHQSRVSMSAAQLRDLDDHFPPTDRLPSSLRHHTNPRRQNSLNHGPGRPRRRQSNPDNGEKVGGGGRRAGARTGSCEGTEESRKAPRGGPGVNLRSANGAGGKRRSLLSKASIDLSARPSMNWMMARHMLQTVKSAAILFVVSVVFILTCLPALLMANKQIEMNLIFFYLFYANHATNPLIYCFMNRSFREDLANIVRRRMIHRRSFL